MYLKSRFLVHNQIHVRGVFIFNLSLPQFRFLFSSAIALFLYFFYQPLLNSSLSAKTNFCSTSLLLNPHLTSTESASADRDSVGQGVVFVTKPILNIGLTPVTSFISPTSEATEVPTTSFSANRFKNEQSPTSAVQQIKCAT